jgi:polysaccharide pyruvyl transferase WcaK-like protein
MIITIFAWIGSQNLWDELILKNEIKILEDRYSNSINENVEFKVFTYDLKDNFYVAKNVEYIEYFPINIKKIKNIFKNILNFLTFIKIIIGSDLIIIWWGGIIYDNEFQSVENPLLQWNIRMIFFKIFRKKVEFFRIWINIKNSKNLKKIKNIFNWAYKISVRDKYSFKLLKNLDIDNVILLEDPVFNDNNNIKTKTIFLKWVLKVENLNLEVIKKIIKKNNIEIFWKKIWFSLRKQEIEKYEENIIEIIKYFLEKNSEIILIPHSFHKTDKKANDFLFLNVLNKRINNSELNLKWQTKISICKSMQESYENYTEKKIDFNFASRLHSIILSNVYKIPFLWISYSKKTDEVLKELYNKK